MDFVFAMALGSIAFVYFGIESLCRKVTVDTNGILLAKILTKRRMLFSEVVSVELIINKRTYGFSKEEVDHPRYKMPYALKFITADKVLEIDFSNLSASNKHHLMEELKPHIFKDTVRRNFTEEAYAKASSVDYDVAHTRSFIIFTLVGVVAVLGLGMLVQ